VRLIYFAKIHNVGNSEVLAIILETLKKDHFPDRGMEAQPIAGGLSHGSGLRAAMKNREKIARGFWGGGRGFTTLNLAYSHLVEVSFFAAISNSSLPLS
jgi:hypothetical protein